MRKALQGSNNTHRHRAHHDPGGLEHPHGSRGLHAQGSRWVHIGGRGAEIGLWLECRVGLED